MRRAFHCLPRFPRTIARTVALIAIAGLASASAQRTNQFPETIFSRDPAPTTALVKGRPVPLSPAYEGLAVRSTLQTGERLYLIAESVLGNGAPIAHLIVVTPHTTGARAAATTHLLGHPIEVGSVIHKQASEFMIAGPTRSFRRSSMQWLVEGPAPRAAELPDIVPGDMRSSAFVDERGAWWAVGKPLGPAADSLQDELVAGDLTGFNALGATPKYYGAPNPTMELFRRMRPEEMKRNGEPDVVRANIGAFDRVGQKVWFGVSFYDSEGYGGVGGIGSFDLDTRKFDMRWGSGDPDCSVSKILVRLDDIWVALVSEHEYGNSMNGAAHYSISRRQSTPLAVPGEIHAIVYMSPTIGTIFATSEGLFRAVGSTVIPLPIEWER